jgi:putative phosphoesterase
MKIVFFSDIHANLPALEAFFNDVETINPDAIYCLGDLVGYNVWANEVVNEIRKRRIPTIMGNHDEALLMPVLKEDKTSNRGLTRALVNKSNRDYLINLPRHLSLSFASAEQNLNVLMVHGSVKSINDYLVEDYPENDVLQMMDINKTDVLLCGHTHKPYHRVIETNNKTKHVINIGSVGKPKDGDPRACYAIVDINLNSSNNLFDIKVTFRRVVYDVEKAARAVEASAFDNHFAKGLRIAQ